MHEIRTLFNIIIELSQGIILILYHQKVKKNIKDSNIDKDILNMHEDIFQKKKQRR